MYLCVRTVLIITVIRMCKNVNSLNLPIDAFLILILWEISVLTSTLRPAAILFGHFIALPSGYIVVYRLKTYYKAEYIYIYIYIYMETRVTQYMMMKNET